MKHLHRLGARIDSLPFIPSMLCSIAIGVVFGAFPMLIIAHIISR